VCVYVADTAPATQQAAKEPSAETGWENPHQKWRPGPVQDSQVIKGWFRIVFLHPLQTLCLVLKYPSLFLCSLSRLPLNLPRFSIYMDKKSNLAMRCLLFFHIVDGHRPVWNDEVQCLTVCSANFNHPSRVQHPSIYRLNPATSVVSQCLLWLAILHQTSRG